MKILQSPRAGRLSAISALARQVAFPLLFLGAGLTLVQPCAGAPGVFYDTGSLGVERFAHSATLLPNGKVLVAGGSDNNFSALASAELYDPATGGWTATGSLGTARKVHTATLLPNGKVLVAGGGGTSGYLASAELYDPASGTWTATGSLGVAHYYPTATLLPNGKVLVAGGLNNSGALASAELYDPASGSWMGTGSLGTPRNLHTATLLPNGKVLVAGGAGTSGVGTSAELYDPVTGIWTATGSLGVGHDSHTATLLPNGKVLVAGGLGSNGSLVSAELYDPASGSWTTTGSLATARDTHTATLLTNGQVLVAAGDETGTPLFTAKLYDPASGSWTATGSLATDRFYHTATLLPDGKVLVAGGYTGYFTLASAELYVGQPPPIFLNISTRVRVLTGDNVLIGGFIITGTNEKSVLIRGIGPSLGSFGVAGALADPTLELHRGSATVTTNDNWKTRPDGTSQQADIEATTIPPTNDLESAISATLSPGAYTAILAGKNGGTGVGLVEVYDLAQGVQHSMLANISARGFVDTGDNVMIGGFIVGGGSQDDPARVMVRAIGPSIPVADALGDPTLELRDGSGTLVASNDNWKTRPDGSSQQAEIEATTIPPTNDLESALVQTLPPGSYTAIVRGQNSTTGVGLVEAYNLP